MSSQNFWVMHLVNGGTCNGNSAMAIDLDNDNDDDVLVLSYIPTHVCWYENINEGVFGDEYIISNQNVRSIYAIDIDNDNYIDVLTNDWYSLFWYKNMQDGTFELGQEVQSSYQHSPKFVTSADINGDGDADLISSWDPPNPGLNWEPNLGNGVFGTIGGMWSGEFNALYPTDLDEDGDIDVVAAEYGFTWFENIDGSIYNKNIISDEGYPYCVYPADIDNDGDIDVVGSNDDVWIGWFENDGNTQFPLMHTILQVDSTYGTRSIFVCDLDNDDDQDVICSFWDWNILGWFENEENGIFGELQIISEDLIHPGTVFCSDIDNDGDQDVLSTSYDDGKVVWFENDMVIGIDNNMNFPPFKVYPNPANKLLHLKLNSKRSFRVQIAVIDMTGKIIIQQEQGVTNGEGHLLINIESLHNGVYQILINSDEFNISKKFVKL